MLREIALRNTVKNWRHSISALLSLAAAFVSLVLFDGYMDDVRSIYLDNFKHRQMLGDVMIENKNLYSKEGLAEPWRFWISKEQQLEILGFFQAHSGQIKNFSRSLQFTGMITNGHQSQIFLGRAYDLENGMKMRGETWKWNTTFGRPLDQAKDPFAVLLGHGLAKKLGCHFDKGKTLFPAYGGYEPVERPFDCPMSDVQLSTATSDNQLNAVDLSIPGLLDAGYKDVDDRYIQTSLEAAQTLLNTQAVTFMAVELNPSTSVDEIRRLFQQEISSQIPDLQLLPW